jgi:alanine racemase
MDQTIVNISELNQPIAPGDRATLIGRNKDAEITASEFSNTAATIPWEVLCSITKRVERVYLAAREI